MNETPVTLVGNLGEDPELRFTPDGTAVCAMRVACTPRKLDRNSNQYKDGETSWYRVTAWRQLAENVAESLSKGDQVVISGVLSVRQYETREGGKGTSVEVEAHAVGVGLQFSTAKLVKVRNGNGNASQQRPSNGNASRGDERPSSGFARPQQSAAPPSDDW